MLVPSAEPPSLMPPKDIYIRNGKEFRHVYTNQNMVSEPVFSNGQSMNLVDIYVESPTSSKGTAKATSEKRGDDKEKENNYLKMVSLSESVNSGSWLICMFKNGSSQTWAPPKVIEVPTDEVNFPFSKTLVINTSRHYIGIETSSGKLASIAPGTHGIIALPKQSGGGVSVKAAYAKGGKPVVICNTSRSAPESTRLVFVFNDNPNSDGRPDVAWFASKLAKEHPPQEEKQLTKKPDSSGKISQQ